MLLGGVDCMSVNKGAKPWYSNKDLFEMLTTMRIEYQQLTHEMQETRRIMKKYNGLYEKIDYVEKELEEIKLIQKGGSNVKESIRLWGGWIFGLITLVVLLITTFN